MKNNESCTNYLNIYLRFAILYYSQLHVGPAGFTSNITTTKYNTLTSFFSRKAFWQLRVITNRRSKLKPKNFGHTSTIVQYHTVTGNH